MAQREEILRSIREALSNSPASASLPAVPEVWAIQGKSSDALCSEFAQNLTSVAGTPVICKNFDHAMSQLGEELKSLEAEKGEGNFQLGIMDRPLTEKAGKQLIQTCQFPIDLVTAPSDPNQADPKDLQKFNASIVCAEYLLTDTGSAVVRAPSAFDRLLCYLSPACFVIAKKSQLREHLPHAWQELKGEGGIASAKTGEFLIVTGPSRTADIEKILILGVHGPKKLVVLILEDQ
ncbi:MAG: LUD domain-containing protein [Thermoguttaceae bacterium]|nr:LUD domain-containing protein [Thermoguttaceae bacterium]